jgi:hypothetical protein
MIDRAAFDRDGYLLLPGAISLPAIDDFVHAIEGRVDDLAREMVASGEVHDGRDHLPFDRRLAALYAGRTIDTRSWDSMLFCREFCELIRHPSLLDRLEPFLGPDITYQGNSHLRPHLPDRLARLPWHQDAQFYGAGTERMVDHMLQVWLPLTDATRTNGCLAFVPGSHRWGLLPGAVGDTNVARSTADRQELIYRLNAERIAGERVVELPMRKGDLLVFTNVSVHTGLENRGDTVRWSVDMRFEATLGSRPLSAFERGGYEAMHRRILGRKYVPLRVRSPEGGETWADWQRRRAELVSAC